jgi:hypothetical protein
MTARHFKWANEASAGQPAQLKHFTFCTALWGHYDPDLMRQEVQTLKRLGINVIGNADPGILRAAGIRTYGTTWSYGPEPEAARKAWDGELASLKAGDGHRRREVADDGRYALGRRRRSADAELHRPRWKRSPRLVPRLPPREWRNGCGP